MTQLGLHAADLDQWIRDTRREGAADPYDLLDLADSTPIDELIPMIVGEAVRAWRRRREPDVAERAAALEHGLEALARREGFIE